MVLTPDFTAEYERDFGGFRRKVQEETARVLGEQLVGGASG